MLGAVAATGAAAGVVVFDAVADGGFAAAALAAGVERGAVFFVALVAVRAGLFDAVLAVLRAGLCFAALADDRVPLVFFAAAAGVRLRVVGFVAMAFLPHPVG